MNAIRNITTAELKTIFFSPIAWLLLIVFMIHSGILFFEQVTRALLFHSAGLGGTTPLTIAIFSNQFAFFDRLWPTLFLYVPLLTMPLISREQQSGSIKLLLSSPITMPQIILGKYFAVIVFALCMSAILLGYLGLSFLVIENVDYGAVLVGILGVFLVVCTFGAVGLFMSSLTSYQIVAAIASWAVLGGLTVMGSVGQTIPVFADITHWLAISARFEVFRFGLVTSANIFYFFALILLFLCLTAVKLSSGRKKISPALKFVQYAGTVSVCLGLGGLLSQPSITAYYDASRTNFMTLSSESQQIVAQMEGDWSITHYVNLLDSANARTMMPAAWNSNYDRFRLFTRFNPNLETDYVYYYDEVENSFLRRNNPDASAEELAREFAEENSIDFDDVLSPQEIREIFDSASEENTFVRVLNWDGREARIRNYNDSVFFPLEKQIATAIQVALEGTQTIAIATGSGEASSVIRGDSAVQKIFRDRTYRFSAVNSGFEIIEADLSNGIDEVVDILVIANPAMEYSEQALSNIKEYTDKGGNLLIVGEPVNGNNLNPVLSLIGLEFANGELAQNHEDIEAEVIYSNYSNSKPSLFGPLEMFADDHFELKSTGFIHQTENTGFNFFPILEGDSSQLSLINADSGDVIQEQVPTNPAIIGVSSRITNGNEQKVVVAADLDFISNGTVENGFGLITSNKEKLIDDIFYWLSNENLPSKQAEVSSIDKNLLVKNAEVSNFKLIAFFIIPAVIFAVGALTLFRRYRR